MIEQTTFLGFSLRTAARRRLLVVLYYGVLLGILVCGLWRGKSLTGALVAQTFLLGGLLGGIRAGGPVKVYSEPKNPLSGESADGTPITLNLSGTSPKGWGPTPWSPLDERDRERRDHAHFLAYRILRWLLGMAACPLVAAMLRPPAWLVHESSLLLWLLLIVILSLPQSVLLWIEPDEPAGELVALPFPAQ